jgi:hypothetical protein
MFTHSLCSLSNRLVSNTSLSSPSTSNSSSGKDIKEDKEYILEDALALDLTTLPPTRARLWESIGLSRRAVKPRSTSADLSSRIARSPSEWCTSRTQEWTRPFHPTHYDPACKSFTALSWSSYGRTSTLAIMLFTTTVNCWNKASTDSLGR